MIGAYLFAFYLMSFKNGGGQLGMTYLVLMIVAGLLFLGAFTYFITRGGVRK